VKIEIPCATSEASTMPTKKVALSGIPEALMPALLRYLADQTTTIVTWSPSISTLIFGASASWKVEEAQRLHIPLTPVSSLPLGTAKPLLADALKPKSLSEVIGHAQQIATLTAWLQSWNSWHRKGARDFSKGAILEPCGVWQLAQSSVTGWCSNRKGPRFSAWH
jgi:hypothetical protein